MFHNQRSETFSSRDVAEESRFLTTFFLQCVNGISYIYVLCLILSKILRNIAIISFVGVTASCSQKKHEPSIPVSCLDSSINLQVRKSNYSGPQLTREIATEIIDSYFTKQNAYTKETVPEIVRDSDVNKLVVEFDTIYFTNLNNNKYPDAIVQYWLDPIGANGTCVLPHKAIISDTDSGYKLTDRDFIPINYCIDSVSDISDSVFMFGYFYDCGNKKILRQLRISLRH
jgi:hypothetical protein